MQGYRAPLFGNLPNVTKNLLIINIVVFLGDQILSRTGISLADWAALHNFQSEHYLGEREGDIIEYETHKKLGRHRGYWFHTIGQRKGLGLGGGP